MKFIKIHWIHNFKDEPEFIYSAIDDERYEVKKVEIFTNGNYITYSENINSDRLAEGIYPLLEELTFEEEIESMQAFEISEIEFSEIWDRYLTTPELEAEIYYLTTEEGGRKTPLHSGYRGQFFYDSNDWDAPQEFIDKEICNLGETVKVYLKTTRPNFHIGKFFIGKEFEIREGAKTVGKGIITKIMRSDFNKGDE